MPADWLGVKLRPNGFVEGVGRAAAKLRAPDQAAMRDARAAMAGVVAGNRTKQAQRDALIWATTTAMGVLSLDDLRARLEKAGQQ